MSLSIRQDQTWVSVLALPFRLSSLTCKMGIIAGPTSSAAAGFKFIVTSAKFSAQRLHGLRDLRV